MKYVVVDLEFNPIPRRLKMERRICHNEIIEIGAVLLDEHYQEIGSFMTLVKPQLNDRIMSRIEMLTHITTEMVESAPEFSEAMDMFMNWCNSISGEIQFMQWSKADFEQLIKEIQLKDYPITENVARNFHNWVDFQQEYDEKLGVERLMSLGNAAMLAGVDFEGTQHDALWDARNTATLLMTVRTPDRCKEALEHVIKALQPEPLGVTMGDLFNFEQFKLAV